MATTFALSVRRSQVQGTKPAGVSTPAVIPCPGEAYITLWAVGSGAGSCKIEQTFSDAAAIQANTATWVSVDASLDSVGTTPVSFNYGTKVATAFRVTALTDNQTATLVVLSK